MSQNPENIPGSAETSKKVSALEQRRCILLAILSATPANNQALQQILSNGLLTSLKPWLEDILTGSVGSVDLLLYFLSSIASLPVTKSQVRDSGMGKKVGSVDKHSICAGTPNETAIKSRVQNVKDSWNASVKALKELDTSPVNNKRVLDEPLTNGIANKKAKTDSFSSLLKKVSPVPRMKAAANPMSIRSLMAPSMGDTPNTTEAASQPKPKKSANKRVKWADHFGGSLEHAREIEGNRGEQPVNADADQDSKVSWSDRSKRDRQREKELFAEAKKKKLTDDDDFDVFSPAAMRATTAWRQPQVTPERTDVTKAVVESQEIITQLGRIGSIQAVRYVSEHLVPSSPAQMSDVETALDMQSAHSSIPTTIPFFVLPEVPVAAPAPAPIAIPAISVPAPAPYGASAYAAPYGNAYPPPPPPPPATIGATVEMVQAMGLPLFLVGSNVQALQTIASNPSLLNTFVDANGMYDQQNLMALVQTLGQSMPAVPQQQPAAQVYGNTYAQQVPAQTYGRNPSSTYGPAGSVPMTSYGQQSSSHYGPAATAPAAAPVPGYRGDKNTEANLHMAGYGPTTTQAEIIALFSPYVRVKEVVMKNGFCFVNTNDPAGAQNAKDNLTGALVGGMPIRINMAQRRDRDSAPTPAASIYGRAGAAVTTGVGHAMGMVGTAPAIPAPQLAPTTMGQIDVNSVRDDRGNPATKNLFVAGYGPSTTESELRGIFGQHAIITGCVMKGNFAFVNTGDRLAAITARQALSGSVVNGGVLRINFAKETGRLGTSFDLTYNAASSVGAGVGPTPARSYYGR